MGTPLTTLAIVSTTISYIANAGCVPTPGSDEKSCEDMRKRACEANPGCNWVPDIMWNEPRRFEDEEYHCQNELGWTSKSITDLEQWRESLVMIATPPAALESDYYPRSTYIYYKLNEDFVTNEVQIATEKISKVSPESETSSKVRPDREKRLSKAVKQKAKKQKPRFKRKSKTPPMDTRQKVSEKFIYEFVGAVKHRFSKSCTGTVISPNHVLSAAHCISKPLQLKDAKGERVLQGDKEFKTLYTDEERAEKTKKCKEAEIHINPIFDLTIEGIEYSPIRVYVPNGWFVSMLRSKYYDYMIMEFMGEPFQGNVAIGYKPWQQILKKPEYHTIGYPAKMEEGEEVVGHQFFDTRYIKTVKDPTLMDQVFVNEDMPKMYFDDGNKVASGGESGGPLFRVEDDQYILYGVTQRTKSEQLKAEQPNTRWPTSYTRIDSIRYKIIQSIISGKMPVFAATSREESESGSATRKTRSYSKRKSLSGPLSLSSGGSTRALKPLLPLSSSSGAVKPLLPLSSSSGAVKPLSPLSTGSTGALTPKSPLSTGSTGALTPLSPLSTGSTGALTPKSPSSEGPAFFTSHKSGAKHKEKTKSQNTDSYLLLVILSIFFMCICCCIWLLFWFISATISFFGGYIYAQRNLTKMGVDEISYCPV